MTAPHDNGSTVLGIDDPSGIGAARRMAMELARRCALSEDGVGRIGIIATELATNLFRHAQGGRLLLRRIDGVPSVAGVELLSVDSGPGMADIDRCLRDGYSSAGTPGNGLGAVRRLATVFDVASTPGLGSVVMARLLEPANAPAATLQLGAVALPMNGEHVSGDAWAWHVADDVGTLLLVDGLGHGEDAAAAAQAACAAFDRQPDRPPAAQLAALHTAMQGTRGGAVAVAQIARREGRMAYAGVGNIGGTLVSAGRTRGLASHHGILGVTVGRFQAFEHAWDDGTMLVMHSDGLLSRWSLDHAGEAMRDAAVIAGSLFERFNRGRDDITVAVVKNGPQRA